MKWKQSLWRSVLCTLWITIIALFITACGNDEHEAVINDPAQSQSTETQQDDTNDDASDKLTIDVEAQCPGTMGPFWKVVHEGTTVYMLGSIHVATPDLYPLHERIEDAFEESDVLAVEADIHNVNIFDVQSKMLQVAVYQDGSRLRDHLSPYIYNLTKRELEKLDLDIVLFERYKPWFVSMLLDQMRIMELGYDADIGVDMHFLKKATNTKEIIELEGMEFQLDMLDDFSDEITLMQLKAGLYYSLDDYKAQIEQLFDLWKQGDAEALLTAGQDEEQMAEITDEQQALLDEYNKIMLDDRNVGMVNKIEQFLYDEQQRTYFVVVGAAHYGGEMGIVQLLEDRGFAVEQIQP